MSYFDDYEDYYNEPSEFEQQVDEFKESLLKSVKQEHISEMNRLKKENLELQEVKKNWNTIESEYKNKIRELQRKIESAESDARRAKLNDIMQELKHDLWQVYSTSVYNPKCNKCDDRREIHFISPQGKDMVESCNCATSYSKYVPKKYELYSFQQSIHGNGVSSWYKRAYEDEIDSSYYDSKYVELLIKTEEDFKLIQNKLYHTFFISEELCQKYCDLKNKENNITDEMVTEKYINSIPKKC